MNSSRFWEDYFLFYWLMELWDWMFGSSGKSRRSRCRSEYKNRRNKRRGRGGNGGKQHDAAIGLLADVYAAFIILPFVLLLASARESKAKRRRSIQARREARSKENANNHLAKKAGYSGEQKGSKRPPAAVASDTAATSLRDEQQKARARREEQWKKNMQATRDDNGLDMEYVAQQQKLAAQEKRRKTAEKTERLEREAKARSEVIANLALPLTGKYTEDDSTLKASKAIEEAEGNRGTYLGLFEVSYLMTEVDAIVVNALVKGDNLIRSINLSNFPGEVQRAISDYITSGGTTHGYTKKSWINEETHTLKVAVYLLEPRTE